MKPPPCTKKSTRSSATPGGTTHDAGTPPSPAGSIVTSDGGAKGRRPGA
ncbi:hypothetical protein [Luteimicrobium album]|nr:hypothetical protein [Luteimicrobium album]